MAMMSLSPQPPKGPALREANPFVKLTRVTFVDSPDGSSRFAQPRRASAVEEDFAPESVGSASVPEETFRVLIACVGSSNQSRDEARGRLPAPSEREGTSRPLLLEHGPDALEWRPGLAIVQSREDSRNDIVAAAIDFAFYEGHLRQLEALVDKAEVQAQADVALAHRVRYRDRAHWERLTDCAEQCSRMRLTYARLEPQLLTASRTLSPTARSWMTRLLQKADMESRLEALSDRLEALEELYEGATQRISEYRWYVGGHALEIGIIVLLVIECAMMGADIYLHNRGFAAGTRGSVVQTAGEESPPR